MVAYDNAPIQPCCLSAPSREACVGKGHSHGYSWKPRVRDRLHDLGGGHQLCRFIDVRERLVWHLLSQKMAEGRPTLLDVEYQELICWYARLDLRVVCLVLGREEGVGVLSLIHI